jgi:transposase-like protein
MDAVPLCEGSRYAECYDANETDVHSDLPAKETPARLFDRHVMVEVDPLPSNCPKGGEVKLSVTCLGSDLTLVLLQFAGPLCPFGLFPPALYGAKKTCYGTVALVVRSTRDTDLMGSRPVSSAPAGYRFPREVIAVAVRWYLRYGLSYRDVEELLAERDIEVDHVTIYRWVQTFTSEFIDAARPARHAAGRRWFVDETYVKVAGRWAYLYRAVDQYGQVIDVLVSTRRDAAAARVFFARALRFGPVPIEVVTDRAPVYPRMVEDLQPGRPLDTSPSGTRTT